MTALLRQAEEILDTAAQAGSGPELLILLDRRGSLRVLEATGWSLHGLAAEHGASAVFKVQKTRGAASVEAWNGVERCWLERQTGAGRGIQQLPLHPAVTHPITLQINPLSITAASE